MEKRWTSYASIKWVLEMVLNNVENRTHDRVALSPKGRSVLLRLMSAWVHF